MNQVCNPLGALAPEEFLRDYWQKKPLVIRQAFPDFKTPISPDELAGLACEQEVASKLVIEKGGEHPWQVIQGPLDQSVFSRLPETHWTLLVNDVEKHVPELAWIVDAFRFIPEWRLDDLMISYAVQNGTVGPHLDQYDVFILQAEGRRRWQLSNKSVDQADYRQDVDLKIQSSFIPEQEWVLDPGDLIYIPPGTSHYGVALEPCMSYSIGFRSPSHAEMLMSLVEHLCKDVPDECSWRDRSISIQQHSNEITSEVVESVRDQLRAYLCSDHPQLSRWLGEFISDTRVDLHESPETSYTDFNQLKKDHPILHRNTASRFAFSRADTEALLYVDGEEFSVSAEFAQRFCKQRALALGSFANLISDVEAQLIVGWFNQGILVEGLDDQ